MQLWIKYILLYNMKKYIYIIYISLKITIYLLIFFILNGFIELYCIKKEKEEIIKLKEYVNEKNKERLYLKKSTQEDGPEWWAIL